MANGRILIVEDDEDLACMLEYNLSRKGYLTISALNGPSACRLIEEERPDLILLDIMLPGMDGWQICRIVRNHEREDISEIPIIMLTALGSVKEKLKGIEMGADDYIPKPFSVKEVLLKVDRLIAREMKKRHLGAEVEKLKVRESQQTDFQDMLFHELRNQLVIIGGYSERIAGNHLMTPEKYRHCAGVIKECSHSLNSITEEMLLLARLETGDYLLPEQDISLAETVRQVISILSRQADEKGVLIHFELAGNLPTLRLNPTAVKVVVSNLLENAIKYSPEGSGVAVRVEFKKGVEASVQVEDRGPGIPASEREKIFDKFYRGKNVRAGTKGTGLGLYISKTLIESMGGAIFLENNPEVGTCFTVVFYPPSSPLLP
ncbi:MAG: response regulator [Deltaproteobacteria bacterium]|nr:response regulator [Deltaproteobacteria bacterium]